VISSGSIGRWPIGSWLRSRRNKPAESNGLMLGFVAGTILLYIPAVLALLALLRG
jgi:hypothetical protein